MSIERLKHALVHESESIVADLIFEIYQSDSNNFVRTILLSECLPEPMQHDFDKKIERLEKFINGCELVEKRLEHSASEVFKSEYSELCKSIADIYTLNKNNTNELMSSEVFAFPFPNIVYMTSVFLENQDRLADIESSKKITEKSYINLFSNSVSDIEGRNGYISMDSNFEAGIEMADLVLGYIFFKGKKELQTDIGEINDVSPYEIASLEKLHVLGVHRGGLNYLWEKVKYRNWRFSPLDTEEQEEILFYGPHLRDHFRLERVAVERYKYINQVNVLKRRDEEIRTSMREISTLIEDLSNSLQLEDISTLFALDVMKLKRLISMFRRFNKVAIESLEFIDEQLWNRNVLGEERDIRFEDVFQIVSYLQALSVVYSEKAHYNFNDEDRYGYKYLTPRIDKSSLITHFTNIYNLEETKVAELLNLLTFKPRTQRNEFSDLFLQPLIYFGNNEVLLVPALLKKFNIQRLIEEFLSYFEVTDANKGHYFERMTRRILATCPYLKVNTEDLVIDAYDGRDAEFDFISIFKNEYLYKLLLIEMKCLRRPYSPKEIFQREKDVFYGVEQVNRRAEVVLRDWEKIRNKSNINGLPKRPPKPEDIIKVVCLNILDFTGKQKDGVFITDFSSITKYFTNPLVQANELNLQTGSTKTVNQYSLWSRNYPHPNEFTEFLKMPHTIRDYYDALEEQGRQVLRIEEGDPNLGFLDYVMTQNPQDLMMRHFRK